MLLVMKHLQTQAFAIVLAAACLSGEPSFGKPPAKATSTPAPVQATPVPVTPPPAPESPSAPAAVTPLEPDNLTDLRAALGKAVVVEGTPTRVGESKSKTVRFLDFSPQVGRAVTLVFRSGHGDEVTVEGLQDYVGKKLRVSGVVSDYMGRLQIQIEKKSQIQEVP